MFPPCVRDGFCPRRRALLDARACIRVPYGKWPEDTWDRHKPVVHYEAAFEDFLRRKGLPYIAVDEAKKALFAGTS